VVLTNVSVLQSTRCTFPEDLNLQLAPTLLGLLHPEDDSITILVNVFTGQT
jgi:hypothetical protein